MRVWPWVLAGSISFGVAAATFRVDTGPAIVRAPKPAQPVAPPAEPTVLERVVVELRALVACETCGIPPAVEGLRRSLEMLKFGVRIVATRSATLGTGESAAMSLRREREHQVELLSLDSTEARVRLTVDHERVRVLDTTLRIRRGRTTMLGEGHQITLITVDP